MQGWIAVTHKDWFDFLAERSFWDEVNFWSPSDYYRFRGSPGEPFFFKLTSPRNKIGGFGHVSAASYAPLPEWLAWECFGEGNGAPSFEILKARLDALRERNKLRGRGDGPPQIGCILLVDAVFFPREFWVDEPSDWGRQNLRYKRYELREGEGLRVWRECTERAATLRQASGQLFLPPVRDELEPAWTGERYGAPRLVAPRLGQGTFRVAVTEAYRRACAVTQEHSLPALEAAHIRPYGRNGPHDVRNGLLLRSDIHRLFDLGYMTVTPDLRFEVSDKLRDDYRNGHSYYPLRHQELATPISVRARPAEEFLQWHNEQVFKG